VSGFQSLGWCTYCAWKWNFSPEAEWLTSRMRALTCLLNVNIQWACA
jgi:hypothetical protein